MTEMTTRVREGAVTFFTLFTSTGTLICCALPIMLVTLGLGAAMAGLTSTFPWMVTLSQNKAWVFAGSGLLLALSGWMVYRPGRTCPVDPKLAKLCTTMDKWNRRIVLFSATIWVVGFFTAYLALARRIAFAHTCHSLR